MGRGFDRFNYYLQQVSALLAEAGKQNDPALYLFNKNARTPFFMLEGLAKLYDGIHTDEKFDKLKDHFKLIEDGFGQIDYYTVLLQSFQANEVVSTDCIQFIKKQLDHSVEDLNEVLLEKEWLSTDDNRIKKTISKLSSVDWLDPEEEVPEILIFYKESISRINEFVADSKFHFENIEKDVHELRRKLRWLSIYPHALQGVIQYYSDTDVLPQLKKYMTDEILKSPFNKFTAEGDNAAVLLINKNYFFALSWILAKLGELKDEGLLLTGLVEAIKQTTSLKEKDAFIQAHSYLGKKQLSLQEILNEAEIITKTFFNEKNLNYLMGSIITS